MKTKTRFKVWVIDEDGNRVKRYRRNTSRYVVRKKLHSEGYEWDKSLRGWAIPIEMPPPPPPPPPVANKLVVITLYKYETGDKYGRTLELDVVGSMVFSQEEFSKAEDIRRVMVSFTINNLKGYSYDGLAKAVGEAALLDSEGVEGEPTKFGLDISDTDEDLRDFTFDRFKINDKDYTEKVNQGFSNIRKKKEDEEEKK